MGTSKDLLNQYNESQTELLIDMDMSGGLFLEYQNTFKDGSICDNKR